MLALFGSVPAADASRAYDEVRPLHDGWQERVELFQLYPLLVHAVLFGGGYRATRRARRAAVRLTRGRSPTTRSAASAQA